MKHDHDALQHLAHCVYAETGVWIPLITLRGALEKDRANGHTDPTPAEALMIVKPNPSLDLKAQHPAVWDLLLREINLET